MKKVLSLALALAVCLGLTAPAFAAPDYDYKSIWLTDEGEEGQVFTCSYSANGYTDPAAENVVFSVAPIGAATIRWVSPWSIDEYTAYVFDQDCAVTRKDGRPFTAFGLAPAGDVGYSVSMGAFEQWAHVEEEWAWVEAGSAGIRADTSMYLVLNFSPDPEDWSPLMMSKKALEECRQRSGEVDEFGISVTVLDHRPLTVQPQPASLAYASTQTVDVDGVAVEFEMYALKNEAGNMTNYIKLRDLSTILNGTQAQFAVGWDGAVNIETGKAYTANGTEMQTPYSGDRAYEVSSSETRINGEAAALDAIVLKDDAGNGYTYYQLRDLGQALGFNVGWSAEKGVFVETDKPYSDAD